MFKYFIFWIKSSNQHGLHSPFVYNYLTKGLYESKKKSSKKSINWLIQSISYFNPNKIHLYENKFSDVLVEFEHSFTKDISEANLIVIDKSRMTNNAILEIVSSMTSNQLLLIHQDAYDVSFQKKLRNSEDITLVVDFYVGNLISKRKEQLKQNFFLRL